MSRKHWIDQLAFLKEEYKKNKIEIVAVEEFFGLLERTIKCEKAIEEFHNDCNRVIDPKYVPDPKTAYSIILRGSTLLKLRECFHPKVLEGGE